MQKIRPPPPPSPPQGYRRFLIYKPGVGQNIALHAAPADRTSFYPPSFCLPDSFNFVVSETPPFNFLVSEASLILINNEMCPKQ